MPVQTECPAAAIPRRARSSGLELLRILCMLFIVADHYAGQSGAALYDTLPHALWFAAMGCGSRIGCSIFVIIGAWFLCEQPFRTKRVLSLWITVWMHTVGVTAVCCLLPGKNVSMGTLRWAVFPVSTRQLWFVSYYIVLLLLSPVLNRLLHTAPRAALRALVLVFGTLITGYGTLFAEDGVLGGELWAFLYLYVLTGYLRLYPDNALTRLLQKPAAAFGVAFGGNALLTVLRALALWRGVGGKAMQYLEYYRTALAAAPALLVAMAAFYWFKALPLGSIRAVNGVASVTLGVYILHQVPAFHDFLWNGIFHAAEHPGSAGYAAFVALATFAGCAAAEWLRARLLMPRLERTRLYRWFCQKGDALLGAL